MNLNRESRYTNCSSFIELGRWLCCDSVDFDWSLSGDISLECRLAEIGSKETEIAGASAQRLLVPGFQEPSSSGVAQGLFFKSAAARAQRNQSAQGQSAAGRDKPLPLVNVWSKQLNKSRLVRKVSRCLKWRWPESSSDNILASYWICFPSQGATHDSIKGHLWQACF